MKKLSWVLALVLVITLIGVTGCGVKVTGGGKIDDAETWVSIKNHETGQRDMGYHYTKITFGFNAQPVGKPTKHEEYGYIWYTQDAKGQLQVNLHDLDLKIHGKFTSMKYIDSSHTDYDSEASADFLGECTINGMPGTFEASYYDRGEPGVLAGDDILVAANASDGIITIMVDFSSTIDGGNIQLHKKQLETNSNNMVTTEALIA